MGIIDVGGPVEITEKNWDKVMAVNVKGIFLACKYCIPYLEKQGSGDIDVKEMIKIRNDMCPMKRMGDAWDVAYAALFLASDEAKYITGANLVVDGGITCKFF